MLDIDTQYQTPPDVARYMASLIPDGVVNVLEPTKGIGNLVRALSGYLVTAPDDYFLLDKGLNYDCVVMNPPFSTKSANVANAPEQYHDIGMKFGYKLLVECMEMAPTVIALMPWYTISDSDVRLRYLKSFGLKSVTLLPRRTFDYARIQTCVFELSKGYTGTTEFKVYDLLNTQQLTINQSTNTPITK